MDHKRAEAVTARRIAEIMITKNKDYSGAKTLVSVSQSLFPELEGISQFCAMLDVLIASEERINGQANWYGVLGVDRTADDAAIKKQFKRLALALHPDKNHSSRAEDAFKLVSEAKNLLLDKQQRSAYDRATGLEVPQPPRAPPAAHNPPPAPPRPTRPTPTRAYAYGPWPPTGRRPSWNAAHEPHAANQWARGRAPRDYIGNPTGGPSWAPTGGSSAGSTGGPTTHSSGPSTGGASSHTGGPPAGTGGPAARTGPSTGFSNWPGSRQFTGGPSWAPSSTSAQTCGPSWAPNGGPSADTGGPSTQNSGQSADTGGPPAPSTETQPSTQKASKRKTKAPRRAAPPRPRIENLWTVCHRCMIQFELPRLFRNQVIVCVSCKMAFMAMEVARPKGRTRWHKPNPWPKPQQSFEAVNVPDQCRPIFRPGPRFDEGSPPMA